MTIKKRIGVLTGGGDCAGLNPAIKWIVKTALNAHLENNRDIRYEVLGIKNGWEGISFTENSQESIDANIVKLTEESVRTWDRFGGTNLGTSRFNPYHSKNNLSNTVLSNIDRLGLDVLITIGGEDTLSVSNKLAKAGVKIIGIPKTIDSDLSGTDYCLGFETALNVITDAVDKLRTTAGSHRRIFIVETMGRTAGWLALRGGESCGAYIVLIPEYDFSLDHVNELITQGRKSGARYDIVLVAEGAKPIGGSTFIKKSQEDMFGHQGLGGIGDFLSNQINNALGLESRSITLGYIQRGGAPCAYDRRMGRYYGIAAVNFACQNQYNIMVSLKNGSITSIPLDEAVAKPNLVNVATMYDTYKYNGSRNIIT